MQLQDAGCWTDAATLAAAHLKGTDYSRSLSVSPSPVTYFVHVSNFILEVISMLPSPLQGENRRKAEPKGFFPSLARVLYQFLVAFGCYIFVLLAT